MVAELGLDPIAIVLGGVVHGMQILANVLWEMPLWCQFIMLVLFVMWLRWPRLFREPRTVRRHRRRRRWRDWDE